MNYHDFIVCTRVDFDETSKVTKDVSSSVFDQATCDANCFDKN
jgi:hypothetical protein